jgi:hypothetical protein
MKTLLFLALGFMVGALLLDQLIIYTREPLPAECDGGEEGSPDLPGEREHIDSTDCWCHPEVIFDYDERSVWVHKGAGEELPPPSVIAQAIAAAMTSKEEQS